MNGKRVCAKIALIAVGILLVIAVLGFVIDQQFLDDLKRNISLWGIVALVIVINLVSFLCFIVLYAAYKWVRRDLQPQRDEELDL